MRIALLMLAAAVAIRPQVAAGQNFTLSSDSQIEIDGTSNKDDWTVTASEISGEASVDADGNPTALKLLVPAAEIVSNKSSIMDRLMYKALKVTEHPLITFELSSLESDDEGTAVAKGNLTIAGVTREANVEVTKAAGDDAVTRYSGSYALKMTDFGMKPPSAMFGALHTGDEVTVRFDVGLIPAETGS